MALNGIEAATSHKYCCSMRAAKKKALQLEQAPSLGVQKLYKNEICSCTDVLLPPEPAWPQVTMQLSGLIAFTHRPFDTGDAFPQRSLSTEHLLHTDPLTHTHKLLHKEAFTHGGLYTEKSLHRGAFTHKLFHKSFYTEELLHTEAFTQRNFYTEKLLHRETFTHSTLLPTEAAFTQGHFYTEKLFHFAQRTLATEYLQWRLKIAPFPQFWPFWPSFRANGLHLRFQNRSFWRSTLTSCERSTQSPRKFACHQHLVRPTCAVPENSHFTLRSSNAHLRSGLPVSKTNLHFTTCSFVGRAQSPQKATFRWTRPGCPCRL